MHVPVSLEMKTRAVLTIDYNGYVGKRNCIEDWPEGENIKQDLRSKTFRYCTRKKHEDSIISHRI